MAANNEQDVQSIIVEVMRMVPELLDGDISRKDRVRLVRLFLDVAEVALDQYESNYVGDTAEELESETVSDDSGYTPAEDA